MYVGSNTVVFFELNENDFIDQNMCVYIYMEIYIYLWPPNQLWILYMRLEHIYLLIYDV